MSATGAGAIAKRGRIKRKTRAGFRSYDHGEPIKAIDTRPMAFVFGLVALVMLFASTPSYPVGTQAMLIQLPFFSPPPISSRDIERPPVFKIRVNAAGIIFINGKETDRRDIASATGTRTKSKPLVSLNIAPNASYESVLLTLRELDRLQLTSPTHFCFLDQWKHRFFEKSVGGSLQILTTLPPDPRRELDTVSDMAEADPYIFEVCPQYRPVPHTL